MGSVAKIFKERLIQNYLNSFHSDSILDFETKWSIAKKWKIAYEIGNLNSNKETSIQGNFLTEVFRDVLGYRTLSDSIEYNQSQEFTSALDNSEADCALGFFTKDIKDVRVIIELKDANTNLDKKQNRTNHLTPVEQAFMYVPKNNRKCSWVIVSNFIEIRLYKNTLALEYERFNLIDMDNKKEFKRFYFFLCKENLLNKSENSLIDNLYIENEEIGKELSNSFYKDYKRIRNNLYLSLKQSNPKVNELILFTKSQKLMDRFVFICFCEKSGLLPLNIKRILNSANNSFIDSIIWNELKGLFHSIDKGNYTRNINQYNGGLFKEDIVLDNLVIKDEVLEQFREFLIYDFGSDLNVNILGQIFEQSISDVEQIKKEIQGIEDKNIPGKQKEDGIYYTPYYVTRYIVENTIEKWLNEKEIAIKAEMLPFTTDVIRHSTKKKNSIKLTVWEDVPVYISLKEFNNIKQYEKYDLHREAVIKLHYKYWEKYEEVLKNIKILDPAVGSGAFLNQCLDYLHEEMDKVLDMKRSFTIVDGQYSLFDIDKEILQNNLFGVDINEESVEITKLSLWLKTAKVNNQLVTLDNNIKCGNSLINSEEVVKKKSFNWNEEFKDIAENGGFDIIIGNPPYGASLTQKEKDYLTNNYITTEYNFDTYKFFFEIGMKLLKENGYLGYITPNTYFVLERGANKLRKYLFDNYTLLNVVELYSVFPTAIVEPVISVFKKTRPTSEDIQVICVPRKTTLSSSFINNGIKTLYKQIDLKKDDNYIFNYKVSESDINIKVKMNKFPKLNSYFEVTTGAKPYQKGKGNPPQTEEMVAMKPYTSYTKSDDTWLPYIRGKSISKFVTMWNGEYIKYGEWLAEPRSAKVFKGEKIFIRQTGDSLIATLDIGNVSNNTLHSIYPKENNSNIINLKYLLGILNSKLMNWYYQNEHFLEIGKPMAEVKGIYIKRLPISIAEKPDNIIELVDKLLLNSQEKYNKSKQFLDFINLKYHPKVITEKILNFYALEFDDFIKELKKITCKYSSKGTI